MLFSIWAILALNAASVLVQALPIPRFAVGSHVLSARSAETSEMLKRQARNPPQLRTEQVTQISDLFDALLRNDGQKLQRTITSINSSNGRPRTLTQAERAKANSLRDPKKLREEQTKILSDLFEAIVRNDRSRLNTALQRAKTLPSNVNTGGRIIQGLPTPKKDKDVADAPKQASNLREERILLLSHLFDAVLRNDRAKLNRTVQNINKLKNLRTDDDSADDKDTDSAKDDNSAEDSDAAKDVDSAEDAEDDKEDR